MCATIDDMASLDTLLITGGHPTPALAVIDALRSLKPSTRIVFIGRRTVNAKELSPSLEYQEVVLREVEFIHSDASRGLRGIWTLPYQCIKHLVALRSFSPSAILSFGGYISVPVCIAGYILGIPIFLHEQTLEPGKANVWLARLARKVMVSYPQTASYFPKGHTVVTGNPIRQTIVHAGNVSHGLFGHLKKPIIFVMGGNLGSHTINTHIFRILPRLLAQYSVIHQVGNIAQYHDWDTAMQTHVRLNPELTSRYLPLQHVSSRDMGEAYRVADLVISRSGASTVTELIARKKPAILIPLPWSAYGEQMKHARLLAQAHAVKIFEQHQSSDELFEYIQTLFKNVQSYIDGYESISHFYDPQATKKIIQTLESEHTSSTSGA